MSSSEEMELTFEWRGLTLAGSLHIPACPGPHPAVVMCQGSGPADRTSGGYFTSIRAAFLERGIATYAFDKPGCGGSSGDWHDYALEARADQASAALTAVQESPAIDAATVGIWGHSQGGWLVQKLAGRRADLAFAVANSAPTLTLREQVLHETAQTLQAGGYDDEASYDAMQLARSLLEAATAGNDFERVSSELLEPSSTATWYRDFPTIDDGNDWRHFRRLVSEPHDPESDLSLVSCPFLAVYGALDILLPAWTGSERSGLALAAAPSSDVTVAVFPNGDHRLQDQETKEFVNGYLELLSSWVADRCGEALL